MATELLQPPTPRDEPHDHQQDEQRGNGRASSTTAGLVLIGLGLVFLSTSLGYITWAGLASLWPLALIVPGALALLGRHRGSVAGGVVLMGLGALFLSMSTGLLAWRAMSVLWPLFLIIPGVALLIGGAARRNAA